MFWNNLARLLVLFALWLAFAGTTSAQCGPGGCPPRAYSMPQPQYAQPAYAYSQGGTGCTGGTAARQTIYYQSPPTVCPECQPQRQAAPLPPPPPQAASDMVLASDGRYYPRSAWQQAPPVVNAYVVESRSTIPVYATPVYAPAAYAAVPVYAPNVNIRERVVIRR